LGITGFNGQLPNPNLKPESGIGLDAGMDFKLPVHFKVGVRIFYITLQDAIVDNIVSYNPSQTQSINAGSSLSKGGEIEISQRINTKLFWFANCTYIITNIKNKLDSNQNNVAIPFSPNELVNIGINYIAPFGLTFAPSLNYNGGFYDGTSKNDRKWFTPGIILNVYIAQRIIKGDSYLIECFANLYNTTNNNYELPWQFKNPGFSGMYGIKVTFK